jgi:hypothetical protein
VILKIIIEIVIEIIIIIKLPFSLKVSIPSSESVALDPTKKGIFNDDDDDMRYS